MNRCIFTLFFLFSCYLIVAQGDRHIQKKEQIKAQKIAFITNEVNLSVDEAQKFWPLYNEFQTKMEEIMNRRFIAFRGNNEDIEKMIDAEIEKITDQQISCELETSALIKEYHEKFKKVLPPKKLLKLYNAEKNFQGHLLKEIRKGNYNTPPRE